MPPSTLRLWAGVPTAWLPASLQSKGPLLELLPPGGPQPWPEGQVERHQGEKHHPPEAHFLEGPQGVIPLPEVPCHGIPCAALVHVQHKGGPLGDWQSRAGAQVGEPPTQEEQQQPVQHTQ
eukprot:22376-Lingulodinium_polyedra.AAC.1